MSNLDVEKKPNVVRRAMDFVEISTREAAIGGAILAGTVAVLVGAVHTNTSQEERLRSSLTDDARTHIAGFGHIEGQPDPVGSFRDTNLADIVLQNGNTCHVSYITPSEYGIFPTEAQIVDLNDCPVELPLATTSNPKTNK